MKLTNSIKTLVTQIVARDIAAGVEVARSLGYTMPKNFDVGVRFVDLWADDAEQRTRIRMRLDDTTYDSIVTLPDLDGRHSLRTVDAMWKTAWQRIHADALTVAQVWIDKHPEVRTSKNGAVVALTILDALKADDTLMQRWLDSCQERAKHFKYTPGPAAHLDEE